MKRFFSDLWCRLSHNTPPISLRHKNLGVILCCTECSRLTIKGES